MSESELWNLRPYEIERFNEWKEKMIKFANTVANLIPDDPEEGMSEIAKILAKSSE